MSICYLSSIPYGWGVDEQTLYLICGARRRRRAMTSLDYQSHHPGYYPCTWPAECGGNRRQKLVGSKGKFFRSTPK